MIALGESVTSSVSLRAGDKLEYRQAFYVLPSTAPLVSLKSVTIAMKLPKYLPGEFDMVAIRELASASRCSPDCARTTC